MSSGSLSSLGGASRGSSTATLTDSEAVTASARGSPKVVVLRLKDPRAGPSVKWAEDTVDNELLGRKSSKRCCIFHKSKKFAESDSDESDSDPEEASKANSGRRNNYQRHHA